MLDRERMSDKAGLQLIVLFKTEAALIIHRPSFMDEIVKAPDRFIARSNFYEMYAFRRMISQMFVERFKGWRAKGAGHSAAIPTRQMQLGKLLPDILTLRGAACNPESQHAAFFVAPNGAADLAARGTAQAR